jgi:Tol biopolymer transport system component
MDEPYVWVIQRDGSGLKRLIRGNAPAFSPKSHQIAFRLWEKREDLLYRVNIVQSDLRLLAKIPIEGQISQFRYLDKPVWSPDGNYIALGIDFRHYKRGFARILISDKDGKNYQTVFTHSDYVQNIQWHPFSQGQDRPYGREIIYVLSGIHEDEVDKTLDKRIVITDLNNPENPVASFKHVLPSFSPDGSRIVFVEREDCMGLKWKVWIKDLSDGKAIPLARTNLNVSSVDWLKRGICIWSTSSYIRAGKYKPAKTIGWIVQLTVDD